MVEYFSEKNKEHCIRSLLSYSLYITFFDKKNFIKQMRSLIFHPDKKNHSTHIILLELFIRFNDKYEFFINCNDVYILYVHVYISGGITNSTDNIVSLNVSE